MAPDKGHSLEELGWIKCFTWKKQQKEVLQVSLPVTTYCWTENKLAEISSSLRQPEQIQKDYSQSKLIIKSADLTENDYPSTLTSSQPSHNVIKTSAEVTRQAAEITWGWSRLGNDDGIEGETPRTDN